MRQQAPWTSEDVTAVQTIGNILGPVRVLSHEETRMTTETAPADFAAEDGDKSWAEATGANVTYPEVAANPHNHTYTWSPKLPDNSMLVIRANTPDELVNAVEAMALHAGRLKAAWQGVVGPQATAPAPQGQFQPQGGVNFNPQTPPPNQPFQGQPAWQQAGAPAPTPGQWQPPAQQGGGQGNKPQPKAQPAGWFKTDKNTGPGADFWKTWREANQGALKGKISWGGGSTFWVAPDVAQMVHDAGFAVVVA